VSERLVAMTQQQLREWLARDLSDEKISAVMIDPIVVAEHTVLVALASYKRSAPLQPVVDTQDAARGKHRGTGAAVEVQQRAGHPTSALAGSAYPPTLTYPRTHSAAVQA
jgi:hypothetical protein